ncbi:ADP-ribosylglycohydrolase family protein [Nocardia sp. R7R-8]|uniref:ADP-ribosylglycohydrolase family protein n=1 Tax=Nocardia sp. R7R-8 TaxID=3459304 RepID=UPI00403D8BBE
MPFTMWVAATHLDDYPTAITTCIAAAEDTDTTSAIVGGIVATYTGTVAVQPVRRVDRCGRSEVIGACRSAAANYRISRRTGIN